MEQTILKKVADSVTTFAAKTIVTTKKFYDRVIESINTKDIAPVINALTKYNEKISAMIGLFVTKMKDEGHEIIAEHQTLFIYNGKLWVSFDDEEAKAMLGKAAERMGFSPLEADFYSFHNTLLKQLYSKAYTEPRMRRRDCSLINVQNGTLLVTADSITLRPHNPDDNLRYCLPIPYDPTATCPRYIAFLARSLPDEDSQRLMHEGIANVFNPDKLEKLIICLGNGRNGKSVVYEIVRSLLGSENVTQYSLWELSTDHGYCRIKIKYVPLNYCSDNGSKADLTQLKLLVSGEPIFGRSIFKKPEEMRDYAKIIVNTNELPENKSDFTESFYRRLLVVHFKVQIPEEEVNVNLSKEICATELPGILNIIVGSLQTLVRNQSFSPCAASDAVMEDYRNENNTIDIFLKAEGFVASGRPGIKLTDLYNSYCSFCTENLYEILGKKIFSRHLKSIGLTVKAFGGKARSVLVARTATNVTVQAASNDELFQIQKVI